MTRDLTTNELFELLQQSREYALYLGELGVSTAPALETRSEGTKPSVVTQTAVTNTSGQAVYKLRLSKTKDPAGVYQVRASASSNGQTAVASASFTVQ